MYHSLESIGIGEIYHCLLMMICLQSFGMSCDLAQHRKKVEDVVLAEFVEHHGFGRLLIPSQGAPLHFNRIRFT